MASGTPPTDSARPSGKLRLAAALGGAGVLAAGFGGSMLQADADPGDAQTPSEQALGRALSDTTTASSQTSEPAPDEVVSSSSSSTPLDPPAADAPPAATDTQTLPEPTDPATTTPPAEPTSTTPAEAPAPAPAAETPAPAAEAPAPAAPATPTPPATTTATTPAAAPAAPTATEQPDSPKPAGGEQQDDAPKAKKAKRTKKQRDEQAVVDTTPAQPPTRNSQGVPTIADPTLSIATPGAATIGVPNFFIDKFRIPPFLLSIYQAAGMEYGIRWEILAAINEIETDYGRNLNVSSAGALGWMQFMPATWKQYGVDANGDGKKDPYNPVDAIFAAARYLKAAGGQDDLRRAIFAYNHADWYVDSVLMRARLVGGLPTDLVGSLTGLTQGRFPVGAKARYAENALGTTTRKIKAGNAAVPVESSSTRKGILIYAAAGSPAIATHDGVIVKRGKTERLGNYVQVRDTYGNTYTYARLKKLEASYPVPKKRAKPQKTTFAAADAAPSAVEPKVAEVAEGKDAKERLFAHPARPKAYRAGGAQQVGITAPTGREAYVEELLSLSPKQVTWKALKPGARIQAGTILGRLGRTSSTRAPHTLFEIRPAGRGAPRIDPKPILDGWKLLESTAVYRAKKKNPFFGDDAKAPTIGQILLMSKDALEQRVLKNPNIQIYGVGRDQIRTGIIDRRALATLEFLAANGLKPTVSSLFREGSITVSGNVSHHASGTAIDIAAVNGIPVMGHQGKGSITDITIRRLLTLQGAMKPDQIISLMDYEAADNTLAMGDHADHIHVGFRPVAVSSQKGSVINATLKPGQWFRVIDRLNAIKNPVVRTTPSKAAIKVTSVKPTARARARAARRDGSSR